MICAEDELGLGDNHDGIMILDDRWPAGAAAAEALGVYSDVVFCLGITPNRSDALSHFGVARDLAAYFKREVRLPDALMEFPGDRPCSLAVHVVDRSRCLRYTGMTIDGVNVGPTPEKYRRRLEAVGQRSINCVVDATNYVMLEIGQPLHAFDKEKIHGGIWVQTPTEERRFERLDGKASVVGTEDLLICDANEPLCIAGVMGGADSGVTDKTQNVFLESAYFLPSAIRKTVRRTQIHTETSYRFERGTDPNLTLFALRRVARLIVDWAGGVASDPNDQSFDDFAPRKVVFHFPRARKLIGDPNISDADFLDVFSRLEIACVPRDDTSVEALVPRYRNDVTRFQDLLSLIHI
jgi:phenylalanyl-tRNA synthetase beta chain